FESDKVRISGLVNSNYSLESNHWNSKKTLSEWLIENKIPGLYDVDTRMLTKIVREKGSMPGKIIYEDSDVEFYDPPAKNLVSQVSTKEKQVYGDGNIKIILVDCGVKYNIIRRLLTRNTTVIRVPWDYDYTKDEYDGLFISNGPGDPVHCSKTIRHIRISLSKEKPIFGICLGNQLLCLAAGGSTYKLKYGHRSHNQPVIDAVNKKCYITSQNHGYASDFKSLNGDWNEYFINLNDGTNEGLMHLNKPFFSTQFHPEASSGPTDTDFLFDDFIDNIKKFKNRNG
ncbi:carbamoyl-phosphate synthase (glutamine-hydrolyzing) small subunit, partial [bacterium]